MQIDVGEPQCTRMSDLIVCTMPRADWLKFLCGEGWARRGVGIGGRRWWGRGGYAGGKSHTFGMRAHVCVCVCGWVWVFPPQSGVETAPPDVSFLGKSSGLP